MLAAYFPNKNYFFLYIHVFGEKIGNRLLEIFTGVIFYKLGMPIQFILLFFGLEFGLRGVLAPLARVAVSKVGIKKAIVISYGFLVVFFIFIGLAKVSLELGFLSFIFQAISRAIYYPCLDTLHSIFIKDGSRGKQYTLELVITAIAGLLAVGIGFTVLTNAIVPAIIAIALYLVIAVGALLFMDHIEFPANGRFLESYTYLASPKFRENLLPLGAESIVIIANIIVVPVFIFTLVKSSSSFSIIILIGIIVQMILDLAYGLWIDKFGHKKTLKWASGLQALGNIGYMFVAQRLALLPFINGFNNTAWDMFSSNYNTRIQQKAQKTQNPLLFNTASQMTLCFVEIIALIAFALFAWAYGNAVFVLIFLSSIAGLYVSTRYFVD